MTEEKTTAESQESVSVQEKILERHIGQGDKAQPEQKETAVQDELVNVGEHQLGKSEAETLESLGYDLENDLSGMAEDDIIDILQNNISKSNEKTSSEKPSVLITAEMVEEGGFAKNLIGKPVSELTKALNEQNREITRLQNELKLKKNEEIPLVPENDFDDDFDLAELSPKEQKEYLAKLVQETEQKTLKAFEEKYSNLLEPIKQNQVKQEQKQFLDSVQTKLPEGMKAIDVIKNWQKENPLTQSEIDFYATNPNRFIKDVTTYAEMKHLKELANMSEEQKSLYAKQVSADNLRKAINNQNKSSTGKNYNAVPRGNVDYGYEVANKIMQRHAKG